MIDIVLNGQKTQVVQVENLEKMLAQLGYGHGRFAVALNGSFVPRSTYAQTQLKQGDEIDVVAPMQGG